MDISLRKQASSLVARLAAHLHNPLYRNGYALASSSVITAGIGMLYWILAARTYPPGLVGLNSAMISVMMLLGGIAQLNLADGAVRFVPIAGRATGRFIGAAYLISLALAAGISLVFLTQLGRWAPALGFLGASPLVLGWFTLSTMGWAVFVLQDGVLTGLRKALWVPVENGVFSVTKIVLMLMFAAFLPQLGVFASWAIGLMVTVLPTSYFIFHHLVPRHAEEKRDSGERLAFRPVARYVAGDYAGALAWLASTSLLPILVTQLAGPAANAYYYLAWQVSLLLIAIASSMSSSLVVEASTDPQMLEVFSYRTLLQTALIIIPAALALVIGAPFVLLLFGRSYSQEATALLRLLVISTIPYIVNVVFVSMAQVRRQISKIMLAFGSLCLLVLSLSYLLIPRMGILGAGYAWLISQSLVALAIIISWVRGESAPRSPRHRVPPPG